MASERPRRAFPASTGGVGRPVQGILRSEVVQGLVEGGPEVGPRGHILNPSGRMRGPDSGLVGGGGVAEGGLGMWLPL